VKAENISVNNSAASQNKPITSSTPSKSQSSQQLNAIQGSLQQVGQVTLPQTIPAFAAVAKSCKSAYFNFIYC
jgi:hypothetical protein